MGESMEMLEFYLFNGKKIIEFEDFERVLNAFSTCLDLPNLDEFAGEALFESMKEGYGYRADDGLSLKEVRPLL